MQKILLPISFSEASANSIRQAHSLFEESLLTLMHCYPTQAYNREYDFGKKNYEEGIREMLMAFYKKNVDTVARKINLLVRAGSVLETITHISRRYDLMVISKQAHKETQGYFLSEKVFHIAAKGHCPVLLLPVSEEAFDFTNCKTIWHIKRKEDERKVVESKLPRLQLDPQTVETKSLDQTSFQSSFWKGIVSYGKTHDKALLSEISKSHESEKIDLIVLVSDGKEAFQKFMRADVMQILNQFEIPILVFQA